MYKLGKYTKIKGAWFCKMLNYIEYLNIPIKIATFLVCMFLGIQIISELSKLKGSVTPGFLKIKNYLERKKRNREIVENVPEMYKEIMDSLAEFRQHYTPEKLEKRDKWIDNVNKTLENNDKFIKELDRKLDKNNQDTLMLLIDSKRNTIINFASRVVDDNTPVTREEFNRAIKLYHEYEDIIKQNGLTNGEIDIAFRIINESYEKHLINHTFIEDMRGYNN